MATENSVTIKFKASGDKQLKQAINAINNAVKDLEGKTGKLGDVNDRLRNRNRGLSKSFATLRSHMLLYSFAMGLGIRQLLKFVDSSAKVKSMERAFESLTGGTMNASDMMGELQKATDGTMSKFDLFQQANNAMILGVTDSTETMSELFDAAQRLGNALGKDTKSSVESLITGIGRQSRLMLDNIGIIVKADEAYDAFAKKIGTTVDKLSDGDKKQAFFNATLESAREKLKGLPPEIITTQMSLDRFAASSDNAAAVIGDAFSKDVAFAAEALSDLLDSLSVEKVHAYTAAMLGAGVAFGAYKTAVRLAKIETISFQAVLAKTGWGTLIALGGLAAGVMMDYFDVFKEGDDVIKNYNKKIQNTVEAQVQLREEQRQGTQSLQERLDLLNAESDFQKELIGLGHEASAVEIKLIQKILSKTKAIKEQAKADKESIKASEERIKVERLLFADINLLSEEEKLLGLKLKGKEKEVELLENEFEFKKKLANQNMAIFENGLGSLTLGEDLTEGQLEYAEALRKVFDLRAALVGDGYKDDLDKIKNLQEEVKDFTFQMGKETLGMWQSNLDARLNAEISALQDSESYRKADSAKRKSLEKDVRKDFQKEQTLLFRGNQLASLADIGFNSAIAITKAIAAFPLSGGMPWVGMIKAMAGIQAGLVLAQKPPKYATGGMVGGRRHSQGGTMIEAEQGEFVMSRSAVEAVGIENMNRINRGGGAITVNVSGNVMTQDFVEGDLAEAIRNAARRGTDFGVS